MRGARKLDQSAKSNASYLGPLNEACGEASERYSAEANSAAGSAVVQLRFTGPEYCILDLPRSSTRRLSALRQAIIIFSRISGSSNLACHVGKIKMYKRLTATGPRTLFLAYPKFCQGCWIEVASQEQEGQMDEARAQSGTKL